MAGTFIIRDLNPQYGGQCYFVGTRRIKDPNGRDCEAADFGDKEHARRFTSKRDAESLTNNLNKIAGHTQFVLEECTIYNQRYGNRKTNGFAGYGTLPREREMETIEHGGFRFIEDDGSYNGF